MVDNHNIRRQHNLRHPILTVGVGGMLPVASNHSSTSSDDGGEDFIDHFPFYRRDNNNILIGHDLDDEAGVVVVNSSPTKKAISPTFVGNANKPTTRRVPHIPLGRPTPKSFAAVSIAAANKKKQNSTIGHSVGTASTTAAAATTTGISIPPHPAAAAAAANIGGGPHNSMGHSYNNDDKHYIYERFVKNHFVMFDTAHAEVRQGQKRSHWVWFIFPTSPYIVNGKERGSKMNRHFALRSDDAVKSYLTYSVHQHQQNSDIESTATNTDHCYYLRDNYIKILTALVNQLQCGNKMEFIFGDLDCNKVISSIKLFRRVGMEMIFQSDMERRKFVAGGSTNGNGNGCSSSNHNIDHGASYRELVTLCNKVLELANVPVNATNDFDNTNHSKSSDSGVDSDGDSKNKSKKRGLFRRW